MQMAILDQKYSQLLYNVINFGSLAFDQDPRNKNWKCVCVCGGGGGGMLKSSSWLVTEEDHLHSIYILTVSS